MKKFILISIIFTLVIFTVIIKHSSKKIDKEIFNHKENISLLKNEFEMLKLEHDYLTSPSKLLEYQKTFFEESLINIDPSKFGEIVIKEEKLIFVNKKKLFSDE